MGGETQQAEEPSQSAVLRQQRRRCGTGTAAVSIPLALAEDTPWLGEAETGPPLTSVGLSVSCNRK